MDSPLNCGLQRRALARTVNNDAHPKIDITPGLLRLPRVIRDLIYKDLLALHLVHKCCLELEPCRTMSAARGKSPLALTCRQVHAEVRNTLSTHFMIEVSIGPASDHLSPPPYCPLFGPQVNPKSASCNIRIFFQEKLNGFCLLGNHEKDV